MRRIVVFVSYQPAHGLSEGVLGADPSVLAEPRRTALAPLAPLAREPLLAPALQLLPRATAVAGQGALAAVLAGAARLRNLIRISSKSRYNAA